MKPFVGKPNCLHALENLLTVICCFSSSRSSCCSCWLWCCSSCCCYIYYGFLENFQTNLWPCRSWHLLSLPKLKLPEKQSKCRRRSIPAPPYLEIKPPPTTTRKPTTIINTYKQSAKGWNDCSNFIEMPPFSWFNCFCLLSCLSCLFICWICLLIKCFLYEISFTTLLFLLFLLLLIFEILCFHLYCCYSFFSIFGPNSGSAEYRRHQHISFSKFILNIEIVYFYCLCLIFLRKTIWKIS